MFLAISFKKRMRNLEVTKVPKHYISVQHVGLEIGVVQTLHFKANGKLSVAIFDL